ncbi:MAG TPA: DUF4097 family beta strand repeat-containing protein, partial [Longimicrobiaceae bacterium]|nr:DUF4097 family beta strand repeat-containing protein [Longimicrobiaceae bacterium]
MKIPAITLAALLLGVATANAQQAVDRTVPTSATGSVSVWNLAGRVTVKGWDRQEIRVTGQLGRGTERLDITGGAADTDIRVVIPRNAHNVQGSELEIHVPAGKAVTVHGTSADVEVDGVAGEVNARSTSGDVRVSGSPATVDAGSTSGDVEVHASTRSIRAHSVSGDVQVSGSARESVSAESVSGDVTVSAPTQDMLVKSVSGDLNVTGAA